MMSHLALLTFPVFLIAAGTPAAEEVPPEEGKPANGLEPRKSEKKIEPPSRPPGAVRVFVTRVIDGHTIVVKDVHGMKHVRLIGVDCPPRFSKDPKEKVIARKAAVRVAQFVEDRHVWLEYDERKKDKYSRFLAYVWIKGREKDKGEVLLNAELVRAGLAEVVRHAPNLKHHEYFLALQRDAQEAKRGLWGDDGLAPTEDDPQAGKKVRLLRHRIVSKKDVSHGAYVGNRTAFTARKRLRCNVLILEQGEPTTAELQALGEQIWELMKHKYDDVFLFFWLPDQKMGQELAYATADYTPRGLKDFTLQDEAYRMQRAMERIRTKKRASGQSKIRTRDPPDTTTVYITRTGKKYHRGSCNYLRQSRIPISLEDVKRRGLTFCSRCDPPR